MTTIGERISLIITDKNLKKVQFARILNIDQSYVTQLIKGRNNPSDRLVEDICQKFNISKNWLSNGSGEMYLSTQDDFLNDSSLDSTDKEIINSYINMTPAQRQFIKGWIKHIAASINDGTNNNSHNNNDNNSDDTIQKHEDNKELSRRKEIIESEFLAEKKGIISSAFTSINGPKRHA